MATESENISYQQPSITSFRLQLSLLLAQYFILLHYNITEKKRRKKVSSIQSCLPRLALGLSDTAVVIIFVYRFQWRGR